MNLDEQGTEALVTSAEEGYVTSAEFLLHSGIDINKPGLAQNPLQAATADPQLELVEFLLTRGADKDAPAYLDSGLTPLQ